MADTISMVPINIDIQVGEVKVIQVYASSNNYKITLANTGIVTYNDKYKEITGVSEGTTYLTATLYDTDGTTVLAKCNSYIICTTSTLIETTKPLKIMLHNRMSDRLVTLYSDSNDDGDTIKLPSTSGTMLTDSMLDLDDSIVTVDYAKTSDD